MVNTVNRQGIIPLNRDAFATRPGPADPYAGALRRDIDLLPGVQLFLEFAKDREERNGPVHMVTGLSHGFYLCDLGGTRGDKKEPDLFRGIPQLGQADRKSVV